MTCRHADHAEITITLLKVYLRRSIATMFRPTIRHINQQHLQNDDGDTVFLDLDLPYTAHHQPQRKDWQRLRYSVTVNS